MLMAILNIENKLFQILDEDECVSGQSNKDCIKVACVSPSLVDALEIDHLHCSDSPLGSDSGCASEHSNHNDESPIIEELPKKRKGGWPKGRKRKTPSIDAPPPKAPATGYVIFMSERRQEIKESHPNLTFYEVTKLLGRKWSQLSPLEKKVYLRRADEDKKRYREELKIYQQSGSYFKSKVRIEGNIPEEPDQPVPLQEEDSKELHCSICDLYFINQHNKREHLYGRQHLANIKGELEKETKSNFNLQMEKGSRMKDTSQQTILNSLRPVHDVTSAIELIISMNSDRESEILHLQENINRLRQSQSDLLKERHKWQDHRRKSQQDLLSLKNTTNEISALLVNLRNVPKLFGVINF